MVIKAVLFDLSGRQLAAHAVDGRSLQPRSGHVERDLNDLGVNARVAIRARIEESQPNVETWAGRSGDSILP